MKRLCEVQQGNHSNYLIPLFWQHGEDYKTLNKWVQKIYDTGIKAFCIESRPHPDFLGDKWWADVDFLISKAKQLGMKVWLFDDVKFPTGYCCGKIKNAPQHLKKQHITHRYSDVIGEMKDSCFYLFPEEAENLISVCAVRRDKDGNGTHSDIIDLTPSVKGRTVFWDIPEGVWRIFITSRVFEAGIHNEYMNNLVSESTQLLIDTVYEKHYARYSDEFGKTIAGFFSDEPGFYNIFGYNGKIGRDMKLPWSDDLHGQLTKAFGKDFTPYYPFLWDDNPLYSSKVRYVYMDTVTKLYQANVTDKIGNWCRTHNVEYMGHIIEDNSAHRRLGFGAGHYFRSLWGQDYAGIDVVLLQILPGKTSSLCKNFVDLYDGAFFHYTLAKLGASLARIDPKKQGRALCEIFGAYGWVEGVKLMKWLADHMLVRGINYFMPHAFTPKEFPDPDCPPYFYAGGHNPQYRFMHILMNYMNKMCHLFNGGKHIASAAVFYLAESEWAGDSINTEEPMPYLMKHQLDADIIPFDIIEAIIPEKDGFRLGSEHYPVLIMPECTSIPYHAAECLSALMEHGNVFFVNKCPQRSCDGLSLGSLLENAEVIPLEQLSSRLTPDVVTDTYLPDLRTYHYRHEDADFYMIFNEHPYDCVSFSIKLNDSKPLYEYDVFENKIYYGDTNLTLSAYQSVLLFTTDATVDACQKKQPGRCSYELNIPAWDISFADAFEYPNFSGTTHIEKLTNLSSSDAYPDYSGTIRYETFFNLDKVGDNMFLDLGRVYETAELTLNGVALGTKICPPYIFDLRDAAKVGKNHLVICVTNTLAKQQKDYFSCHTQQEPTGLLGPLSLKGDLI